MVITRTYDQMLVHIYDSNAAVGEAAAADLAAILRATVDERGEAAIIVATGNSQLSFYAALCRQPAIAWSAIDVFHMDEYLGISEQHPASFRRVLREKLVEHAHPRAFYGIQGDAPDVEQELARYAALLRARRIAACVLGIGENGHLAFNDPPADFATEKLIALVTLDEAARRQQVGEGHFPHLDAVPTHAITLTIPTLLAAARVLAVVPEGRKAVAVQRALEGPISPDCPASILRTVSHGTAYLDRDSAALLQPGGSLQ